MLNELGTACERQDWPAIKAKAHELKGTAANFGYPQLAAAAVQLELKAEEDNADAVADIYRVLRRLQARIENGLSANSDSEQSVFA